MRGVCCLLWKESWGRRMGSTIPLWGASRRGHAGFRAAWAGGGTVCRVGAPGDGVGLETHFSTYYLILTNACHSDLSFQDQ